MEDDFSLPEDLSDLLHRKYIADLIICIHDAYNCRIIVYCTEKIINVYLSFIVYG